ncbi:MAG: hypothetical protein EOP11_26430, partial [Proteobacteria bacterium]
MKLLLTLAAIGAGISGGAMAAKLPIQEIIGKELSPDKVRGIYRYSCFQTYLEGEGVQVLAGETRIDCPANQRLGLIHALYNYYLYDSKTATNDQSASSLSEKSAGALFATGICLKNDLAKASCGFSPSVRYGLYGERAGIFQVGVA